jgi:osmotically-inducible protein OsmY
MCPDLRIGDVARKFGSAAAIGDSMAGKGDGAVATLLGRVDGSVSDAVRGPRIGGAGATDASASDTAGQIFTDAELAQSVLSAIRRAELLPIGKVRSVVRNGWLILEGEVEAPSQRRAAEEAVRGLNGIRGISNNILIESEVMAQRVSQKIDETFVRCAKLSAQRVSVTARDHQIILSGYVRSCEERAEAETAAWAVPGVAQVINRIRANI